MVVGECSVWGCWGEGEGVKSVGKCDFIINYYSLPVLKGLTPKLFLSRILIQ